MLNRCKAPPENMLNMPSSVPFWVEKNAANLAASMPGTGMKVPIRYTMSAPTRNNSRLRISAKRVMSPKAAAGLVADVATGCLLKPRICPPADSTALLAPLVAVMTLSLMVNGLVTLPDRMIFTSLVFSGTRFASIRPANVTSAPETRIRSDSVSSAREAFIAERKPIFGNRRCKGIWPPSNPTLW